MPDVIIGTKVGDEIAGEGVQWMEVWLTCLNRIRGRLINVSKQQLFPELHFNMTVMHMRELKILIIHIWALC